MTNGSSKTGIKAAIWLTCHSRMFAEKRYRSYTYISHLLLSWLALGVIAWAVVHTLQTSDALLDTYSAILSVLVFALSIIVFGFRFGETATLHRECYLRLQKLHDSESDTARLIHEYHEILGAYPSPVRWPGHRSSSPVSCHRVAQKRAAVAELDHAHHQENFGCFGRTPPPGRCIWQWSL